MYRDKIITTPGPLFSKVIEAVLNKSPFQKREITRLISSQDAEYFSFAEKVCTIIPIMMEKEDAPLSAAGEAYATLCRNLMKERLYFERTGMYRRSTQESARQDIYNQPDYMTCYLIGLLLSYCFWENHYQMVRMFRNKIIGLNPSKVLEIGAGHGLFTTLIQESYPECSIDVVDISRTSIELTKSCLLSFKSQMEKISFIFGDFLSAKILTKEYDLIVMGELLEHVEQPKLYLERARSLLSKDGVLYVSTCANSPAPDHIYHFRSVEEIQTLIDQCDLKRNEEFFQAVDSISRDQWVEKKAPVNYASFLQNNVN